MDLNNFDGIIRTDFERPSSVEEAIDRIRQMGPIIGWFSLPNGGSTYVLSELDNAPGFFTLTGINSRTFSLVPMAWRRGEIKALLRHYLATLEEWCDESGASECRKMLEALKE